MPVPACGEAAHGDRDTRSCGRDARGDDTAILTVALAGNPNAGKTALFNAMTGVRQKTGNWPGVTVERKLGRYCFDGEWFTLVDLPGTYSLDATSPDQLIARDAVLSGDIDVVVNVLDASNLERHLNLAVQLAEMQVPMVLALNMMDVAERQGITIDVAALGAAFGCEVVPVVGTTGRGIHDLEAAIARAAASGTPPGLVVATVVGAAPDHTDDGVRRAVCASPSRGRSLRRSRSARTPPSARCPTGSTGCCSTASGPSRSSSA